MIIPPRLVIIGPEPGIRRTYNLIGFPIIIGSSDNANITIKECNLADQHIFIEQIEADRIRIRNINGSDIVRKRVKILDKIIDDRDVFVAEKLGIQFFIPSFDPETNEDFVLEYLTGKNIGKKVFFDSELTIGRKEKNNIHLPYKKVSGTHGSFKYDVVSTFTDFKSRNGSRVNGKKVLPNTPVNLQIGDIIDIASHSFYLRPVSYNLTKINDKYFQFLSEVIEQEPTYEEYSPIAEYSQMLAENPDLEMVETSKFTPAENDASILLEISSSNKDKIPDNIPIPKVTDFEVEEMSASESISDSFEDLHDKIKESARNIEVKATDEEDMLFLGPDEDYDSNGFNKMLREMQENKEIDGMRTVPMPNDDFVDIKDWDSIELTDEEKKLLSDTYFNKIKKSDVDNEGEKAE